MRQDEHVPDFWFFVGRRRHAIRPIDSVGSRQAQASEGTPAGNCLRGVGNLKPPDIFGGLRPALSFTHATFSIGLRERSRARLSICASTLALYVRPAGPLLATRLTTGDVLKISPRLVHPVHVLERAAVKCCVACAHHAHPPGTLFAGTSLRVSKDVPEIPKPDASIISFTLRLLVTLDLDSDWSTWFV